MDKAPHGLGHVVAWGVMPLSVGKWGAGLPLYLNSEVPITVASGTRVVLGTCMAGSSPGSEGAGGIPERGAGEAGGPGPSRSPEDKRLLIAMATNKPCVVTSLPSPW